MFAASKLAFVLKHKMWEYLRNLAVEHNVDGVKLGIRNKYLTEEHLEELYDAMTEMNGDIKALNKAIRNAGVAILHVNGSGDRKYYYDVFERTESPFEETNDE
jgi:hypothetical protein